MSRVDRERARIVDFWRAVELFEPQKADKPDLRSDTPITEVEPGLPLPWQAGHVVRYRPTRGNRVWRHTVYLGVFPGSQTHDVLEQVFGTDQAQVETHPAGDTALAAFEVDEEGQALLGTQVLSTCGWAIGRTLSPGPRARSWLEGFEETEDRFGTLYEWLAAEPGPGPTRALLTLIDGGLMTGPLAELWASVQTSLNVSAEFSGELDLAAPDTTVSAEAEVEAEITAVGQGNSVHGGTERSRVIEHRELDTLLRVVSCLLGVERRLELGIRIRSRTVSAKEDETEKERQEILLAQQRGEHDVPSGDPFPDASDTPLLNSFIAEDLASVAEAVRQGDYGPALRSYLSSSSEVANLRRTDVRSEGASAVHRVSAERTPAGRWPAKDTHPLVLSQQIAVNTITRLLNRNPGLFAVNGPPGTGKTTLLRDLVAHVVVERARVLARFDKPWTAFTDWTGWETQRGSTAFPRLREELAGFEIVVASANNGAVDNVTTEIPGRDAVDERWAEADYFSATATNMLDDKEAWGTLAAQLGNARNRRRFVSRFWWGDRPDGSKGEHGMQALLKKLDQADRADPGPAQEQWREAVRSFESALQKRDELAAERVEAERWLTRLPSAQRDVEMSEYLHEKRKRQVTQTGLAREEAEGKHLAAAEAVGSVRKERSRHWEFKPGFWDILFSLGRRLREWQSTDDEILSRVNEAEAHERHSARAVADAEHAHQRAEEARAESVRALQAATRVLVDVESSVRASMDRWPEHVPVGDRVSDEQLRESSAPWSDPELIRARTEVFLAGLAVHEAFIRAVPGKMAKNLRAAMAVLSGEARNAPDEAVRAAVRALFLVVPVVSSTFASFARTFKAFDSQSLGWLLVDEAGQATPQQVVGALWRSNRAVVVGDPLQLEPVSTLPFPAQQHLRRRFEVEERWLPARTSVQALADSVTPVGTLLERDEGEPIWVGSPLRVHRRCDEPMFTVSNSVAYDGMMVYGTPERPDPELPPSQWVHVPGGTSGSPDHWQPEEGEALKWLLDGLSRRGHTMDDVFVLAPFRSVAAKVAGISKRYGVRRSGTIHTSQGKEASVVVFVLGGSPSREGALEWASKTPNLLNVAASRAKRRLYVIGNHGAWAHRHHFKTLGQHLPLREPSGR